MGARSGAGPDPSLVEEVERLLWDDRDCLLLIARRNGPVDHEEDILGDAYVEVRSGKAERKHLDEEVLRWLRRVVRNVARNRRRREGVRAHEPLEAVENRSADGEDGVNRAWRRYGHLRLRADLEEAFETLSESELEVAEARLLGGRKHREIAEARRCSVSTTQRLWCRAKAKLRDSLEPWFGL